MPNYYDRDQEICLLSLVPKLYTDLLDEAIMQGEKVSTEMHHILQESDRKLQSVYYKDIHRQLRFDQQQPKAKLVESKHNLFTTQKKQNSQVVRGLTEYYLGRLDKAISIWTQEIMGKTISSLYFSNSIKCAYNILYS